MSLRYSADFRRSRLVKLCQFLDNSFVHYLSWNGVFSFIIFSKQVSVFYTGNRFLLGLISSGANQPFSGTLRLPLCARSPTPLTHARAGTGRQGTAQSPGCHPGCDCQGAGDPRCRSYCAPFDPAFLLLPSSQPNGRYYHPYFEWGFPVYCRYFSTRQRLHCYVIRKEKKIMRKDHKWL